MIEKLLLLALFCLAFFSLNAFAEENKITCEPGKEMRYQYTSIIKSFSGKKKFDAKGKRIHQARGEKSGITATVCLTCTKKWKRKDGKWDYLWNFRLENVQMEMKLDNSQKWNVKSWKGDVQHTKDAKVPERSQEQLAKYFTQPTGFLSSSNGKIYNIYHAKNEEAWVNSMKKSVIDQLQTKLNVDDEAAKKGKKVTHSRLEGNGVGLHKSHYKFHRNPKDGAAIVQKKYTDLDAQDNTLRDEQNHREMKLKSKTSFVMNPQGHVKQSISKKKIHLGTHTHAPRHGVDKYWFKRDYVPHENKGNTFLENGDNHFLNGKEYTMLDYLNTVEFSPKHKEAMNKHIRTLTAESMSDSEVMTEKHPKIELSDEFMSSTLIPEGIHEYALGLRKQYLKQSVNFADKLKKLMEKPENLKKAAKLVEYLSHFKELAPKIYEAFVEMQKKDPNHEFLKMAQMILASIDTEESQKLFLKTWVNKALTRHGILKALEVKTPSKMIVEKLKAIYNAEAKPLSDTYTEEEREDDMNIKVSSYLVMADLASKLPIEEASPIVEMILNNIMNNKTFDGTVDAIVHLHALGNAGSRAPLEVIFAIINSPTVNDRVKGIALQALRKRISDEEEDSINSFIHKLVVDPKVSEFVKKSAIELQTIRENKKSNARSIEAFTRVLFDINQHEVVKNAALDYLKSIKSSKSKKAAKIIARYAKYLKGLKKIEKKLPEHGKKIVDFVAKAKYLDEADKITDEHFDAMVQLIETQSDSMFLRRLWRGIRRAASDVGRAIGRAASAVGRTVARVASGVVDAVKKGAEAVAKVGKVFDQIKAAFSAATFSGPQVCLPASTNPNDKICAYQRSMIDFIARQGDSSIFTSSKHASFEKLVGTNKLNLYAGVVGLAGTNFNCGQPPSEFIFTLAARAEIAAKIFSKEINLVTAEGEMRMRGQFMDHVYVKVIDTVVISKELIPTVKINKCETDDKQLYQKNIGNLPAFSFTVMLGPIPVEFGFSITAEATVTKVAGYCTRTLKAEVGIVPSAGVGIAAHAAVSIFIAKAGIEVSGTFNYGLYPNFNIRALECKACATLQHRVRPMALKIKAFAEIGIFGFSKKWDVTLVNWNSDPIDKVIVEACAVLPKYRTKADMEMKLPEYKPKYRPHKMHKLKKNIKKIKHLLENN